MLRKDKRARIATALTIAGVMLLGVAVAPVAATIGTQTSSFDDQEKSQRCKKNKKNKKKKCKKQSSPTPGSTATTTGAPSSPAPSASGTAAPTPAPSGSGAPAGGEGRVVEFEYVCPCVGLIQLGTLGVINLGGGPVDVEAGEVFLTAVASDASGTDVAVSLRQDDGTGANAAVEGGDFCNETEAPIALTEGRQIRLFIGSPLICPGVLLGGTITITLTKAP